MGPFIAKLPRIARTALLVAAAMLALGAGRAHAAEHEHTESEPAQPAGGENSGAKTSGIELGQFRIRTDYPVEAQKSTVRFVLYAAVKGDRSAEMQQLVEEHRQKVRDLVITATRLAPLAVFEEPDLTTFRRRILIRLRRSIPELAAEDLYISDFGLMVKSL